MKNRGAFLLLISFLFSSSFNFSQTNTFETIFRCTNTYFSQEGTSVIQTSDGGYLVGARNYDLMFLIKVNSYGDTLWHRTFNKYKSDMYELTPVIVLESSANEYALIGSDPDNNTFIVKTNLEGDILWTKVFDHKNPWGGVTTNDTSIVIVHRESPKLFLTKISHNGSLIWEKEIDIVNASLYFTLDLDAAPDGFVICSRNYLLKVDLNGDFKWKKNLSSLSCRVLKTASDGGCLVGVVNSIIKFDSLGNIQWSSPSSVTRSILEVSGEGYYTISSGFGTVIKKFDFNGVQQMEKNIAGSGIKFNLTADKHFIITGKFNGNIWLVNTDLQGNFHDYSIYSPGVYQIFEVFRDLLIEWTNGMSTQLKIEFSQDDGNTWSVIENSYLSDSCKYLLTTPFLMSSNCRLKITDVMDPSIFNITGPFTITPPKYSDYIAANEIKMWISKEGSGSHSPLTDGSGFFYPSNTEKTAIFSDGLVWGGLINGEVRLNGDTYRYGLQAGNILPSGLPANPSEAKFGIWKIKKGWESLPPGPERQRYEFMHNNWPGDQGAPYIDVNGNGIFDPDIDQPDYVGDEVLFYTANDLDSGRSVFTYGSPPIGLEFQTTVWAYDSSNYLDNTVFKRYLFINKSQNNIDSIYLGYWMDDDLGFANDDYIGCDTNLNLQYTYNGDNNDEGWYGTPPPAVGHIMIQGPIIPGSQQDSAKFKSEWRKGFKNSKMSGTGLYINGVAPYNDPDLGVYEGSIQFYNNLKGYLKSGAPYIDPNTNEETRFCLPGDPVNHTGWYEGPGWPGGPAPDDRRSLLSTGPFNMAPGDTQEIIIAIYAAQGTDNINSVEVLKDYGRSLQEFWGNTVVGIKDIPNTPYTFKLEQNFPNPFNPETVIRFQIPERNTVQLKLFNILGEEIALLLNQELTAGVHDYKFNAADYSSGVYFYQIKTGDYMETKKMILMK